MFIVDTEAKKITLHRGDTGIVPYRLTGYTLGPDDRVLYTIKDGSGSIIFQKIYAVDENNCFRVEFRNELTDYLGQGMYKYDARVAILPEYDPDDPTKIINVDFDHGGAVATPVTPLYIELLDTVGQI